MTNKQPSKQEIIDAIKKKADKAKQVKQAKQKQPNQTYIQPTQTINKVQSRDVQIVKQITKPSIESRMSNIIDNRCRYWIENRISQLLSSDNFTTREGYSFSIDNDRVSAGLCFRFTKNGTTLAKIDSNGYLYCANVFSNGTNLLAIAKFIDDINSNSSIYVEHTELKNGTYVMNIKDIKTKYLKATNADITSETVKDITITNKAEIDSTLETPLTITNSADNSVCSMNIGNQTITGDKTNNKLILNNIAQMYSDQWNTKYFESNAIYNYFTSNTSGNVFVFGKNYAPNNCVIMNFQYTADASDSNYFALNFHSSNDLIKLFKNAVNVNTFDYKQISSSNSQISSKIGYQDGNNGCFNILFQYAYNSDDRYTLLGNQGYPGLKFWRDRLEALLPLTIDTINATTINATTGNIATVDSNLIDSNQIRCPLLRWCENIQFHSDSDMIIDFKKMIERYNDRARIIYTTSGTYNNTLSLDINKSHSIIARVYSDGGGQGNTDYFTTIKHVITLLDGDGKTTLKNVEMNQLTVNTSATFNTNYIEELFANLSAGSETLFTFGTGTSLYQAGNLAYHLDSTLANSYISLYLNGMSGLNIYADKTQSITPFYCPSLYINGTQFDPTNVAYTNVNNYFTANQTINGNLYMKQCLFQEYNGMVDNSGIYHVLGDSNSSGTCAYMLYHHKTNLADRSFSVGLKSYAAVSMYYDHTELWKPISNTSVDIATTGTVSAGSIILNGTDLATTLSNCAKLNAANTFTADQTINGRCNVGAYFFASLSTVYSSTDHRGSMFMEGTSFLDFNGPAETTNPSTVKFNKPIISYEATIDRLQAGILTCAGVLTCSASGDCIKCFKSNPSTQSSWYIKLGNATDGGLSYGYLRFYWHNTNSAATYLSLGLRSYNDIIKVYYNKVDIDKPLTVNGACTATSYSTSSDRRKKKNINELTENESKNIIDNIKTYSFNFKNDEEEPKRKHYGVIAQELQEVAPELVYDDGSEDHYLSVNYTELIPHLINKIKQQDKQIESLMKQFNELKDLILKKSDVVI